MTVCKVFDIAINSPYQEIPTDHYFNNVKSVDFLRAKNPEIIEVLLGNSSRIILQLLLLEICKRLTLATLH